MKIEYMTLEDVDSIKNILKNEFDDFWSENILKSEIINENTKYIVAKIDDEIVGFAGVLFSPDVCEIMNIVVKKNKRRQGIGKELLSKLIEIAKKNNFEILTLEVNDKNISAKTLYESFGFENVGLRKKYYNNIDDAIIMNLYI